MHGNLHHGSDGPLQNLTAKKVEDFIAAYGFHHRILLVANPNTNSRVELVERTVKRIFRGNPFRKLDTTKSTQH